MDKFWIFFGQFWQIFANILVKSRTHVPFVSFISPVEGVDVGSSGDNPDEPEVGDETNDGKDREKHSLIFNILEEKLSEAHPGWETNY